ncbi:MAG: hypothetical protein QXR17_06920 [Candidatus Bathyarchaeia archaeon]
MQKSWFKQWGFVGLIFAIGLILLLTGFVGLFTESFQLVIKKAFLLAFWYGVTYIVRIFRVGHIHWDELPVSFKAYYYFVLLLGSAMIIAWG